MKSPGIIYRRYRQLKKKLLYEMVTELREATNSNCFYGKRITINDSKGVAAFNLCMYRFDDSKDPEICSCPKECNAFANKWTKDKIIEKFNKDVENWNTKVNMYPDLVALEWVLDKDLAIAMKSPRLISKIVIFLITFLEKSLKYISK